MERTLVVIKPDGLQRCLAGELISRFEKRGIRLVGLKMMWVGREFAEKHYAVHLGKPFYEGLVEYICSSPVVAMVLEAPDVINTVRLTVGRTRSNEAAPGTIRGDYGMIGMRNLIHASDAPETAESEIALWFKKEEIFDYQRSVDPWIYLM